MKYKMPDGTIIEALEDIMRHCVTAKGLPDKGKGRTPEQQTAIDRVRAVIARAKGGVK